MEPDGWKALPAVPAVNVICRAAASTPTVRFTGVLMPLSPASIRVFSAARSVLQVSFAPATTVYLRLSI